MNITTDQAIDWVTANMPDESAAAIAQFTVNNPHYRGAGWDDVLAIMLDADADLQWTEPLREFDETFPANPLEGAVLTTLVWAVEGFFEQYEANQIVRVRSIILNTKGQQS
jgi:hypothetical protein